MPPEKIETGLSNWTGLLKRVKKSKVSELRPSQNFSKFQLVVFLVIFGAIGGYLLYRGFAASQVIASVEAENMVLPAGSTVGASSSASGGKAVQLITNGSLTSSLNLATSASSLTVMAYGTQCSGSPTVAVSIDGGLLLPATAVSATSWTAYSATVNIPAGSHNLTITASNLGQSQHGKSKNNCSRVLYLDITNFYGTVATAPIPTVALSASPTAVSAGSASTLTWSSTNATSCSASGAWSGSQPTSGSVTTGALNSTSSYTLSCTGTGGSASASATVSVSSGFTTSLTSGMTITPPYTWTFNPGVASVKGYFYADGNLLATATPSSNGVYTFVVQSSTLSAGAHILGHAWDLADATHQTPPSGYNVTVASGTSTSTSTYATATNFPAPTFTPTRTIDVSSQSAFMTAWNNIQPGDQINVHGVTFTGEVILANKALANWAQISFDSATKFVGYGSAQNYTAIWINKVSHVRFYGGDISDFASGGQAGNGVTIYDSSYVSWWNFVIHDTGGQGLFATGITTDSNNLDLKGEIYHWGLNLAWDPHTEKGTGIHAALLADSYYGVQASRFAIYAHDGASGAGIEVGGSASTDFFKNNTVYAWCQNLTKVATSQVAGNCIQAWGNSVLNNTYKYIEAENLQGRPYDANGIYSSTGLTTDVVEYGIASNTNLNLYLSSTESAISSTMHWDTRGGTVFQNVSPKP